MNGLTSLRVTVDVRPSVAGIPVFKHVEEYLTAERARFIYLDPIEGGRETCIIGIAHLERSRDQSGNWGLWEGKDPLPRPFSWPDIFPEALQRTAGGLAWVEEALREFATAATNVAIKREEDYGGRPAWVISYEFRTVGEEGAFTIWRTEWIAKDSFLLLRQEQRDNDPFGSRSLIVRLYGDFDAPITIECGQQAA